MARFCPSSKSVRFDMRRSQAICHEDDELLRRQVKLLAQKLVNPCHLYLSLEKDIACLKRQLQCVGNPSHVVAPGDEPNDTDRSRATKGRAQSSHVIPMKSIRVRCQCVGKGEGKLLGRSK